MNTNETNEMSMCKKLKWTRKQMGLSQRGFAEKVGLSAATIVKLENDKTAWVSVRNSTEDKINDIFEQVSSKRPTHDESRAMLKEVRKIIEEGNKIEEETEKRVDTNENKDEVVNPQSGADHDNVVIIKFLSESFDENSSSKDISTIMRLIKK